MTRLGGWTIEHHDRVGSTNDLAKTAARAGTPDHTVYVADEQTAGHGRGDHTWASPPGGLYASLLLRRIPAETAPLLALVGTVALRRSLSALAPSVPTWMKWPNDVLAAAPKATKPRGKLAGVLVDGSSSGAGLDWAVVGIGVNVATPASALPRGLVPPAVSLAEWLSPAPAPLDLLDLMLEDVNDVLELAARSRAALIGEAEDRLAYRGAQVSLQPRRAGMPLVRGTLAGLDRSGAVRILTSSGEHVVPPWDVDTMRAAA